MAHDDDARVADLLARLGEDDTRDLFRRLLERALQELIDAELTSAIGAAPHEMGYRHEREEWKAGVRIVHLARP